LCQRLLSEGARVYATALDRARTRDPLVALDARISPASTARRQQSPRDGRLADVFPPRGPLSPVHQRDPPHRLTVDFVDRKIKSPFVRRWIGKSKALRSISRSL